jgi:hypothetical protein
MKMNGDHICLTQCQATRRKGKEDVQNSRHFICQIHWDCIDHPAGVDERPVRRRLTNLPAFVVNRGGEYCFVPSLSAIRWLSQLDT